MQLEQRIGIHKWLIKAGLEGAGERDLVSGFSERLTKAGVNLQRFSVGSDLLHPLHEGRGIVWTPSSGPAVDYFGFGAAGEAELESWTKNPFYKLFHGNDDYLVRHLNGDYRRGEFPLLDELKEMGMATYLASRVLFGVGGCLGDHRGIMCSFGLNGPPDFDEAMQSALVELTQTFALAYKSMMEVFIGRTLMRTYLGANAATRVLGGGIRRGEAEVIESVLWYSDLKGFTRIADTAPRDQLMPFLNDYAECVAQAIERHGGEILKFMGDGVLAMFPATDKAKACNAALDAAVQVITVAEQISRARAEQGLPVSEFHLGLHSGTVQYGNIGSRERLDFTVIGPTVNELARIENMCRILDQKVVASSAFAMIEGVQSDRLVSLGRYALRGVARPQELFTIDPEKIGNHEE